MKSLIQVCEHHTRNSDECVLCVNLFQSLDFMFHFHLSGPGVVLGQPLALSWMFHLQLKTLQILQLPTEIIDQLRTEA